MLNNLKIRTKIGASFALGLVIFATISLVSYRNTTKLIAAVRWETHTYQVLGLLEDLNSKIKDAETDQRGYIITGEKRYLEPYNAAITAVDQEVKELQRLTADNPNQQRRLNTLQSLLTSRLAKLQETINLRNNQGSTATLPVLLTDGGKKLMDALSNVIIEMETEERELLKQRSREAEITSEQTIYTIAYGIPLFFVILTLIGFFLARNISKPLNEISNVTARLATGDLSASVPSLNRWDEIGMLTQTFNQMIASLRETTRKNNEQDWFKSNLAKFNRLLQGHRNLERVSKLILSELAPLVGAQQGVFYLMDSVNNQPLLRLLSSYAYQERKHLANQFRLGEGLVGQCALEKERILLTEVPENYIKISSGLGEATPLNIIVLPVLFERQVTAVIELASFQRFSEIHLTLLDQLTESIGVVLNKIGSDMRTEQLLKQSQSLTEELQSQQEELTESNQRLVEQARSL